MPTILPPPLDVRSYHINALVLRTLEEYDPDRDTAGDFNVDFDVQRSAQDEQSFRIIMHINVAQDGYTVDTNPSHSISLTIVGYFSFAQGTDEEQMQRMIRINGSSILYGIARGLVGQATGASKHGQFVLPTVNFVEIVKAKEAATLESSEDQRQLTNGESAEQGKRIETAETEHA